jgi:hypothetical protein
MEFPARHAIAVLILWGLAAQSLSAQREIQKHPTGETVSAKGQVVAHTLTPDDGLAVIAAALDSRVHPRTKRDCSELVHAIYDRAGFLDRAHHSCRIGRSGWNALFLPKT